MTGGRTPVEYLVCLGLAVAVHGVVLTLLPAAPVRVETAEEQVSEMASADAEIAALVEAWDTPPETGEASNLDAPETVAEPSIEPATEAELAVEAGEATEALQENEDPGESPDRPIMASLPKTRTAPPPSLAGPAPTALAAPAGFAMAALSSPSPGGGLSSSGIGGGMASLSAPGMASPSRPMAPPPPPPEEELAEDEAAREEAESEEDETLASTNPTAVAAPLASPSPSETQEGDAAAGVPEAEEAVQDAAEETISARERALDTGTAPLYAPPPMPRPAARSPSDATVERAASLDTRTTE